MVDYISNLDVSPSLQHYGILGMKWGVRRYQNKDGSYTSLGKKRRTVDFSEDYKNAHDKRDTRTMSDAELKKVNERLNLERKNRQLTQSAASRVAGNILTAAVTSVSVGLLVKHGNAIATAGSAWLSSNGAAIAKTALTAAVKGKRKYVSL